MPTPSPSGSPLARVRDAFWLETALREVTARTDTQQSALRLHYLAGSRRADVADQLTDEDSAVASLLLYRDALLHFAIAAALAKEASFDPQGALGSSPVTLLKDLRDRGQLEAPPADLAEAETILASNAAPLAFDSLPIEEVLKKRATMAAATRYLRDQVEPRTAQELKVRRLTRTTISATLALVLLVAAGWRLFRPTNLAADKPVTVSARYELSTAPADNSGAVNGEIEASYGIHTALGGGWVTVDLQKVYRLSSIKLYNRADAYFSDGLPYTLELSEDGTHFTTMAQRVLPFSATSPWQQPLAGARARYVRIRSANYVAFTEIEVFGST